MDLLSWTFADPDVQADKPILIDAADPTRSLSTAQLRSQVRRLIAGLQDTGIGPGDCVLVNAFNDVFYSVLYFGIMGCGGIFTGVNPAYKPAELAHHIALTQPKLIIAAPALLPSTLAAAAQCGLPPSAVYQFDLAPSSTTPGVQSWTSLLAPNERSWIIPADPATAPAHYASTSGTSGLPKAAILPHSYHVSQASFLSSSAATLPYTPIRLTALPPFHVFSTPIVPSSIRSRIPTYIAPRLDIPSFIATVSTHGITETYLAPPTIVALGANTAATSGTLRSLRQVWFGGAQLARPNREPLLRALHPNAAIQPVWGMTEAGWVTAGRLADTPDDSVGCVLPGYTVRVASDGELLVRGPALMLGYLRNEEASAAAWGDGWLRTGDVGREEGGKVWVVDRAKDLLKVRAWQVSPAEVEGVILAHPGVADAAVVGVELGDGSGEVPRAYVVRAAGGGGVSAEEVRQWTGERLARYKVPEEVVFVDCIPKNPTGKVLRRVLREEAKNERPKTEGEAVVVMEVTETQSRVGARHTYSG
ncbi:acetyl-CoA synthetase-like protein [Trichodelitschia bisporula]|uniref:Acetyl-CoA synthetase-like protein n=1 Tax=Trichodelitschia bisporula TaxID=703511 RepID=A0A6G1HIJ4_9PEZI|nr:acetyl-CoA synthetase-like protein [Trichodelitschia bisporula]